MRLNDESRSPIRRAPRRFSVSLASAMTFVAIVPSAGASSFAAPVAACDPHTRRVIDGVWDPAAGLELEVWHRRLTYRDVCDIERYVRFQTPVVGVPADLYPNASNTDPKCSTIDETPSGLTTPKPSAPRCGEPTLEPWDLGYRYAQLSTAAPSTELVQRDHALYRVGFPYTPADGAGFPEEIKGVGWPVCARVPNASEVYSDPSVTNECMPGFVPVGFCVPSAHHNERLMDGTGRSPARTQFSFVHNPAECTPCGHDVRSAVDTCKQRCDALLSRVYWNPGLGRWRFADDPFDTGSTIPVMGDAAIDDLIHPDIPLESSLLEQCQDLCGPPYQTSTPFAGDPAGDVHDEPPWVRSTNVSETDPENDNHWKFVTYGRWTPSKRVDGWLRSYNNTDNKPHSVGLRSPDLIAHYCDRLDDFDPSVSAASIQACKATNPRLCPAPPPNGNGLDTVARCRLEYCGNADGVFPSGTHADCVAKGIPDEVFHNELPNVQYNFGFFRGFHRNNFLCEDTCTVHGSESEDVTGIHWCGPNDRNLPLNFPDFIAKRFDCGPLTATCDLKGIHCNPKNSSFVHYEEGIDGNNQAVCQEAHVLLPAQETNDPVESSNPSPLVALFYDGYGQHVSLDMVDKATFRVHRDPNGTEPVAQHASCVVDGESSDNFDFELVSLFGWWPNCPGGAFQMTLAPGVTNYVTVTFRSKNEPSEATHQIAVVVP